MWDVSSEDPDTNHAGGEDRPPLLGTWLETGTISAESDGAKKSCFVAVVCAAPGSCMSPLLL